MYTPSQRLKEGVGTVYTMAPEVVTGNYNNKADVWAVGVLAYMLLSSQMPFFGRRRKEILDKIARCNYDFKGRRWSAVSKQAGNFIIDLLMHDPEARPSAREAKQSLWLNMRLTSSVRTATEDDMDAAVCSLEHYSTHKTLQKLALMVVAHKSNSEEIGYLRNVFKRYDKSRHGTIVFSEFKQCLSKYNYEDAQVEKLFHAAVSPLFCAQIDENKLLTNIFYIIGS
jgi:calcium-dependent protein kinase